MGEIQTKVSIFKHLKELYGFPGHRKLEPTWFPLANLQLHRGEFASFCTLMSSERFTHELASVGEEKWSIFEGEVHSIIVSSPSYNPAFSTPFRSNLSSLSCKLFLVSASEKEDRVVSCKNLIDITFRRWGTLIILRSHSHSSHVSSPIPRSLNSLSQALCKVCSHSAVEGIWRRCASRDSLHITFACHQGWISSWHI